MAIAFGGISSVTNATPVTSVAVSGADTIGFVSVMGGVSETNSITAVTWGGVSMTEMTGVRTPGARYNSVWYVTNPGSAAAIAFTGGSYYRAFSFYVTGARQTTIPDSINTGTVSSNANISVSTTVVTDDSWLFMFKSDNAGGRTDTPSNDVSIARITSDAGGMAHLDSNGTVASGSRTATNQINTGVRNQGAVVFSIAPTGGGGGGVVQPRFKGFSRP